MTPRHQTWILRITFLAVLLVLPLYAWKVYSNKNYTDFGVYYRTAERIQNHQWNQIYDLKDGASPFRYSPIFLPFFQPLKGFTPAGARLIWYFLQCLWFMLGFYYIFLTIRQCRPDKNLRFAHAIGCLSFLFILRFCLDTLTIGQVSSFMFFGFSAALYFFVKGETGWSAASLLIPTLFKLGPAFQFGIFLTTRWRDRFRAALVATGITLTLIALSFFWLGENLLASKLWQAWALIVAQDSTYYDASHYGSQSITSVLLRLAKQGFLSAETVPWIYRALALLICGGILTFWATRTPKNNLGKAASFSLGLFVVMWMMPETFKYSLTPLAIPAALLFAIPTRSRIAWVAILFGIAFLSLAGKDVVGDWIFFQSQIYSLPFLATVLIFAATLQLAWIESEGKQSSKDIAGQAPAPRRITADDWGMSPGINRGILNLAKLGVVRRVSIMANGAHLEDGLEQLKSLRVELGLHFNLTYGRPVQKDPSPSSVLLQKDSRGQLLFLASPSRFLIRWLTPWQNRAEMQKHVRGELLAQLEKLSSLGVPVCYLDGHHHIHLVPGLLQTVADVLREFRLSQVRLPFDRALFLTSQAPITILAWLARRPFARLGLSSYSCVYPQKSVFQDPAKLRAYLARNPEAEIIVHPADTNDLDSLEFPDSYTFQRVTEYQALQMLAPLEPPQ